MHGDIISTRIMPYIHELKDPQSRPPLTQISVNDLGKLRPLGLAGGRITISGEIRKPDILIDPVKIDLLRLAGRSAHAGKRLATQQSIEQGRLPDIAAPDKGKFRESIRRPLGWLDGPQFKFHRT